MRPKRKVLLIRRKDGSIVKKYNAIIDAETDTGISNSTIVTQCLIKCKSKTRGDNFFLYESDYEDYIKERAIESQNSNDPQDVVQYRKEKIYYVNILVGLANGTLEDGAVYKINGNELVYNKELNRLEINGTVILTQQAMFEEIEVDLPLLNEKEMKFLKTLLKAFDGVKGVRKCNDIKKGYEFIRIENSRPIDNVDLPAYVEGKYYKSLMQNRLYTLEELKLM